MKKAIYLILFLLGIYLALASVSVDKSVYPLGNLVAIRGNCDPNEAVGIRVNYGGNNVWINQVVTDNAGFYSTQMQPSSEGTYTVYAACQGDSALTAAFCVGDNCISSTGSGATIPTETPSPSGSSGGFTGSSSCQPEYQCSPWSLCNTTLQQTRTCTDQRGCKPVKTEVQNCTSCLESWICSGWSECSDYNQYRTCVDEHDCGTAEMKPLLEKDCQQAVVSGPQPAQISTRLSPPLVTTPAATSTPAAKKGLFMDLLKKYGWYLGGFGLLLLIILLIVILIRHKRSASNIDDLVDWMRKEKEMGVSGEQMLQTLASTDWTPQEIDLAKKRLI